MLKDKVVVVTGGAGRIGSAFIRAITSQNGVGVIAEVDTKRANLLKSRFTLICSILSIRELAKG